jgi:type VI secretion system protein ImpH
MAADAWRTGSNLERLLAADPTGFDFQQAVRLIEAMTPLAAPVGEGWRADREPVRFESAVDLTFPISDIAFIKVGSEPGPARMRVTFMGLAGAHGPLPQPYADHIDRRFRQGDRGLAHFLDLFNHRLISLLYRARKSHRPFLQAKLPEQTLLGRALFSTFGLGMESMRNRSIIPDGLLLRHTASLMAKPRTRVGLERMLSDMFKVPIRVRQFAGRWLNLDAREATRIGRAGQNNALGKSTVLGRRLWDQQGAIELLIGPLPSGQFRTFLPDGRNFAPLKALTRLYLRPNIDVTLRLSVDTADIPAPRLMAIAWGDAGAAAQAGTIPQAGWARDAGLPLGRMSWLIPVENGKAAPLLSEPQPHTEIRVVLIDSSKDIDPQ